MERFRRSDILARREDFGWIVALPNAEIDLYEDSVARLLDVPPEAWVPREALEAHKLAALAVDPRAFHLSAPLVVAIEVTRECNLSCVHCYLDAGQRRPRELTEARLHEFVDDLARIGVFCVQFTGGEPLLRRETLDLVEHAHRLGMVTALATNGLLLTPEIVARLPQRNFSVGLSLDGIGASVAVRGPRATFDELSRKVLLLRDAGVTFDAMLTLNRVNMDEAAALIAWCDERDVFLEILDTQPFGRAKRNASILPQLGDIETDARAYQLKEELEDRFEKRHGPRKELIYPGFVSMCYWINLLTRRCKGGRSMAYVTADGRVFPCSNCASEEVLGAGSLSEASFGAIWQRDAWPIRAITWDDYPECRGCDLAQPPYYCCGRCPALSHAKFDGDLLRCGASEYTKAMLRRRTAVHRKMHETEQHTQSNPARVVRSESS
jgi:radical SAM protein with 4Fe4S-binding SPASM domain